MEIVASYSIITNPFEFENDPLFEGHSDYTDWNLVKCPACSGILFQKILWCNYFDPDEWKYEILYPFVAKPLEGLPDKVNKAYKEALNIRNIDCNAFAVLLGRVLDIICIDQKAEGKSLYERLKNLSEEGKIPERLMKLAHGLRDLRNIGAHADLGGLTQGEIPILEDICRAILEYVYIAPKLLEQVEMRINKLKNKTRDNNDQARQRKNIRPTSS
ncbi:MAG: DUF4145 domain-containing protein [Candidatus Eremiobacteraeota bacterium]|nr:DUF4145 domain-containing protein [Candidatus Eremiobacteraeota bacterium]